MKAIIKSTHPIAGYVVIFEDGREIRCATIDEAMKIKDNKQKQG